MITVKPVISILQELDAEANITIPFILKKKILMSPGVWNGLLYDKEEIEKAYLKTNWDSKETISLFLDHEDNKVSEWVGWVKNPRLENGNIVGDLEIWDKDVALKLFAGAKFGISPKVKGLEIDKKMTDFEFLNFSIVTNPAVKAAYINLNEKKMEEEKFEEVEEEESKKEEELAKKKKYPYPEKNAEKTFDAEAFFKEISSSEETLSEWTEFVKKYKKKYPDITFEEIAKIWKEKKEEMSELEKLDEEELTERLEKIMEVLKKKKKGYTYPYPSVEKSEEKENKEIEELKQKVKELSEKLNEPEKKTLNLAEGELKLEGDSTQNFWNFLREFQGSGKSFLIAPEK